MSEQGNNSSLGETLKNARIAKGLTLDDLQQNTKIQKRYLIDIEDQNYDDLPGDFYVRAFIKQYADSVGLNGTELLKQYDQELPSMQTQEYIDRMNEDNLETRSAQRQAEERTSKVRSYIPIAIVSVIVVVILLGIWFAAAKTGHSTSRRNVDSSSVSVEGSSAKKADSLSSERASSSSKKAEEKKQADSKKASAISFKKDSSTSNGSTWTMKNAPKGKKTVEVSTSANCWTSLTANGSTVYQGAVKGKHSESIPSNAKSVKINLGNANVATLKINGKKLDFSGNTKASSSTMVQTITVNFS
ncbi:helix-turn-helix domain-containing protein [Levilactobacillus bambusae]|uniref:DUF4115 domain-containing protein n=1 Tax=Levilactobacillus bambusae TaxID=2024736 RepID=A0A2V1MXK8_9LACO|nr:RodZ domain-containing protein [Levilactobacillus bambusae]PWF99571.1 DUF4115 domain-containing protein [Levilactobacillus bambusae]